MRFELSYIADGVFNISRRHQGGYMPEKSCDYSRKKARSSSIYYDGVCLETAFVRTHDEYSQLVVTISIPNTEEALALRAVELYYKVEYPLLITFQCEIGYTETMSMEGGVTRECRAGDSGVFERVNGEYK